MSNRRRRERAFAVPLEQALRGDLLARWRSFVHRGTRVDFVMSGIFVDASTPDELVAATDAVIVKRTKDEPEN